MKLKHVMLTCAGLFFFATGSLAATLGPDSTEMDSTQPRGDADGQMNTRGQLLDPIEDGFMSPQQRANYSTPLWNEFHEWGGSAMAQAMRDPSFLANLSVSNKFFIRYLNSLPGDPTDPTSDLGATLVALGLGNEGITRATEDDPLTNEDLLPVTADLCLRCHTPAGWMEGHSEPPTTASPFLKGQFWGAAFLETPIDGIGDPRIFDPSIESEAELEGVQCGVCHRLDDAYTKSSSFGDLPQVNGNGGFFFTEHDDLGHTVGSMVPPSREALIKSPALCGTCHNVTNPLIKTATMINGEVPDMQQPIERTYTEWLYSDYSQPGPGYTRCQDCHTPMTFPGAQTYILYPGLADMYGDMDKKWSEPPYNYDVPLNRHDQIEDPESPGGFLDGPLVEARARNEAFMQTAATVEILDEPKPAEPGKSWKAVVRVTNLTGHKLPTGYPEGRQMWIDLKVVDLGTGDTILSSGNLDRTGALKRTLRTKVYEIKIEAEGYDTLMYDGFPLLDADQDGTVSHEEKEFHFLLGNNVIKDNRIPPKGFNKAAYMAEGAFIIPHDRLDNDYPDGQNWDDTVYKFGLPADVVGPLEVTATLKYETFSREFVKFLNSQDDEKTQANGGRARNLPEGRYADKLDTWGKALNRVWWKFGKNAPVEMAQATRQFTITPP